MNKGDVRTEFRIWPKGPFDLRRSLCAAASFLPAKGPVPTELRVAVEAAGQAAVVTLRQSGRSTTALCSPSIARAPLRVLARRLVAADLDLTPFYRQAGDHPVLGPITKALAGVKPLPPPSLFEMAVIAITEQQLSLAAAFSIRSRLVERFGRSLDGVWLFPSPERLAGTTREALSACGLSARKAAYIATLATRTASGELDLEGLRRLGDADARGALACVRGLGPWSIDYILIRGLGRADSLPSGDVGLQRVVGGQLEGRRLSQAELQRALEPFRPYRGLAAFYVAAYARLAARNAP